MCWVHSAKHKLQGAKNEWNSSSRIVVIPVKSGLKIRFFSAPLTYVFSATAIIPLCMYFHLQQRAESLCRSQAFWWARQWSSQSMMSHLNQQVSLTNTRLTESWDANKGWGWGLFLSVCNLACFCDFFFPAVVGVKLNVSVWMNSFMNATLKVNVSCVQRWVGSLWEKGLWLWNVILRLSVFFVTWERDSTLSLSRNTQATTSI